MEVIRGRATRFSFDAQLSCPRNRSRGARKEEAASMMNRRGFA